jgi:hypothetical protein
MSENNAETPVASGPMLAGRFKVQCGMDKWMVVDTRNTDRVFAECARWDDAEWIVKCMNQVEALAPTEARRTDSMKPVVVCLCGSTRFTELMLVKQWELTKQGKIVLSWCALPDSYFTGEDRAHIGDQEGVKAIVDEVHKRKIDLADEVLILNVGDYIGESTRSELDYAIAHGKTVRFLEPHNAPAEGGKTCGECAWFDQECSETCTEPGHAICPHFEPKEKK